MGRRLLDAYADIQDMLQGVFPHDLFESERVGARMIEFCRMLDLDPVFIDIVHTAAGPSFLVVSQGEVIALAVGDGIPWLTGRAAEPDIVVIVGVGMAKDKVDVIAVRGIFSADIEAEGRAEITIPF